VLHKRAGMRLTKFVVMLVNVVVCTDQDLREQPFSSGTYWIFGLHVGMVLLHQLVTQGFLAALAAGWNWVPLAVLTAILGSHESKRVAHHARGAAFKVRTMPPLLIFVLLLLLLHCCSCCSSCCSG